MTTDYVPYSDRKDAERIQEWSSRRRLRGTTGPYGRLEEIAARWRKIIGYDWHMSVSALHGREAQEDIYDLLYIVGEQQQLIDHLKGVALGLAHSVRDEEGDGPDFSYFGLGDGPT